MQATDALEQPLPTPLLRKRLGWASYQSFPVFSWSWLRRRTSVVALALAGFLVIIGLTEWYSGRPLTEVLVQSLVALAAGMSMTTGGPMLATIVRTRGLRRERERVLVVVALLGGLVVSFVADGLASELIEQAHPVDRIREVPPQALVLNLVALVVLYGLFGGGLAVRRYFVEASLLEGLALRERAHDLDTQLGMLQAQVEPHFLFNSLASVRSLVERDPAGAVEAIDALVAYLRATIPKIRGRSLTSSLGEQMDLCDAYLRLMKARMGRLEHAVQLDPRLREVSFPPLILLTLVENAIKHGIEPKCGAGRVEVEGRVEGDAVVLAVRDDGVGLEDGVGGGMGLSNVISQLGARYGGLASFSLSQGPEGGACASITIQGAFDADA